MFKHPKYYQELAKVRKQLEKEQARKLASEQAGGRVGPKDTSSQATNFIDLVQVVQVLDISGVVPAEVLHLFRINL